MGIFSELRWQAFATGKFVCPKCGSEMVFRDRWETELFCPDCGYEVDSERYGFESEAEYDEAYPILEDVVEDQDDRTEAESEEE